MALNVPRANYDAAVHDNGAGLLQLPWFSDQYHQWYLLQGNPVPAALQSADWRTNPTVANKLAVNDMTFASVRNTRTGVNNWTISPRSGVEFQIRSKLAQIGFKPDASAFATGVLMRKMLFSRVQDLDTGLHGQPFPTIDPLIQSHVVPYVYSTYTPAVTGPVNVPVAFGLPTIHGNFLSQPWPRALNVFHIWNQNTNKKYWPRGSVIPAITASGPRYEAIQSDGTFQCQIATDPGITPFTNVVRMAAGVTYALRIGHVETLPGQYPTQRWPGYTWKVGDGITW